MFCQIDEDNSGTLDTEELYAYLADMEEDIANELMQELDANGDGVVDFAEFVVGWNNVFSIEVRARASRRLHHAPTPPPAPPLPPVCNGAAR